MKTFQRDLSGYDTVFGHIRSFYTCADAGTETDIDAISAAIPMFCGKVFTGVYVDFARHFLPQKIPRWPTYTGSSYNFATENDTKVISTAVAMFQGTPDPPTPASTLSD